MNLEYESVRAALDIPTATATAAVIETAPTSSSSTRSGTLQRVEVNQRALIDKILARYASASAVYRELLQNSNDAGATVAEIHFTTADGTASRGSSGSSNGSSSSGTPSSQTNASPSSHKSTKTPQLFVTQVVYRNNGAPFGPADWDRLQKIAEGNPDVHKVGAFGVGAYTMFSITEEPVIASGNMLLAFVWRGDALYTLRQPHPHASSSVAPATAVGPNVAKDSKDSNDAAHETTHPWTTFYLPSRDPYPLPDWLDFGQFLTAAVTFTQALRTIRVVVNGRTVLTVTKTIRQAAQAVVHPITTTHATTQHALTSVLQSSKVASFLWNTLGTTTTHRTAGTATAAPNSTPVHSSAPTVTRTKLFTLQTIYETLVSVTVHVDSSLVSHSDTHGATATARMEARYISATASARISADMSARMERVTKKPPPPTVTVHCFLNDSEPTAALVNDTDTADDTVNAKTKHSPTQALALSIAQSFAPVPGQGRIFIGFRTSQTTGLGAHVAAPFVPTVEREAMDLQHPMLAVYNRDLLELAGLVLRVTLEHVMHSVIQTAWHAAAAERQQAAPAAAVPEASDLQSTAPTESNNGDTDEADATSSKTGLLGFALYMARGVKKKMVSVAKSVETLLESGSTEQQLLHPVDTWPLSPEEQQAIVLMSSFCPQQSTPDPAVGTALAQGFSNCMPGSSPPVLTKSGVVPGNEARLPHLGMERFVSDGVVRTILYENAEEYHTVVARCRRLQWDDLVAVVQRTIWEQDQAVTLIKWWTYYSKLEPQRSSMHILGSQLKDLIQYHPVAATIEAKATTLHANAPMGSDGNDNRPIVKLSEYHFFTESNSPFARRDVPLPETVIPGPLQDAVGGTALTSRALRDVWFSPMPIEIFAEYISRHECLNAAKPEDDVLRVQVLSILSREFMRRQGADRSVFGGLCTTLLSNRRSLPFDSDVPTAFAADFPGDLYLYSAELKAFDGIGSFHKVAGSLQAAGVTDDFLLTLGVRKSVSIDFLFTHLDTLSWSQNPKALVEYLRTATLTRSDFAKLSSTKYLPATDDSATTYAPGELYLPNKDLRILPFVKTLAWPEPDVSENSDNGTFLRGLGMKTLPPLVQVLAFLTTANVTNEQRLLLLDFVCDRLVSHGAYYSSFNSMAQSEKKKYRILPSVIRNPFDGGQSTASRSSPVDCFSDPACAAMGFPVVDPALGKQGKLYGALFQCEQEPESIFLLNQLTHLVSVAKDKLKSVNANGKTELQQRVVTGFDSIFKYLSHRSADLSYSSLERLGRESFIPFSKDNDIEWHRPDEVFFRRANRESETLTEELFNVIDFSPFLAAAGVKEEATTRDLFQKMLKSPQDVLSKLGNETKYRSLLRRIAADPPFSITRPSVEIRNAPFLLAYTMKPYSEEKSEKSEGTVEDKTTYQLAKASEIFVIDNSNFGRMFPVYRAPPETDLEDFYIRLGSRYISKSVERRFEVMGTPKTNTSLSNALKDRLSERGPLLVSPSITSRPLVHGAASILHEKRLEFHEAANLLAVFTLGTTSRRSRTTCFSRPNGSKNAVYVTADFDMFDVGQAIGDLILQRCQLEDAFFIGSLLETPLDQLRSRGFPIDRIIKPEPAVVIPEKPKPSLVPPAPRGPTVVQVPDRKPINSNHAAATAAPTERKPEPASTPTPPLPVPHVSPNPAQHSAKFETDASEPMPPPPSTANGDDKPPNVSPGSKADILLQMFPDADPNFVQAALGNNPSVDDVKELADKMANGHYPKKDSSSNGDTDSTTSTRDGSEASSKKSFRHRLGRAFGKKGGSSLPPPPVRPGPPSNSGSGNMFVPPSATTSVEQRGPVSPEADAQSQTSLERMLEQSVGTSNRVQRNDIDAPESKLTSIPPELDRGQSCEVIPGHSLKPFLGARGNGLTRNGVLVFSSKAHPSSEVFVAENEPSLEAFSVVLERLCSVVFGLHLSTVAIYHDPAGVSIAFNRNRALHFNFRFFHGLHWLQGKHNTSECYAYWYVTITHELAHHLVSGHTKEHGFYTESYSQLYMPKLLALLRSLDIN